MKPLILEYIERPNKTAIDTSIIEYSDKENLNLLKGTSVAAIEAVNFDNKKLQALSNLNQEQIKDLRALLDTNTHTFVQAEATDNDPTKRALLSLIDTQTLTEAVEATDSDK